MKEETMLIGINPETGEISVDQSEFECASELDREGITSILKLCKTPEFLEHLREMTTDSTPMNTPNEPPHLGVERPMLRLAPRVSQGDSKTQRMRDTHPPCG